MKNKRGGSSKREDMKKEILKVTYISSPVKVKTSASNFRALVQELTGQDSNVAEITPMPSLLGTTNYSAPQQQQWRVQDHVPQYGYLHDEATLLTHDYSHEFLSRSTLLPLNNQHQLPYDLLSFPMPS